MSGKPRINPNPGPPSTPTQPCTSTTLESLPPAMQIFIGFMYITFGVILGLITSHYGGGIDFESVRFTIMYPFWAGLFFVITGVLSKFTTISTEDYLKNENKWMNICSAISAVTGATRLGLMLASVDPQQDDWTVVTVKVISILLIIFSLLEFCITVATTYFILKN